MRRKLRQGLLLVAAVAIGLLAPQAGAEIIIDNFSGSTQNATDWDGPPDTTGVSSTNLVADPNVFGGYRHLYVNNNTGDGVSLTVNNGASFTTQEPTIAPDPIAPDVAFITWDADAAFSLAPNYSDEWSSLLNDPVVGNNAFQLKSNTNISVSRFAAIQVWDRYGNSDSVTFEVVGGFDTHNVSFNSFSNLIDFGQIGAIRLHFLTDDLRFDAFTIQSGVTTFAPVVPVPAAAGLGILGMAVVAGFRRRSSANVA